MKTSLQILVLRVTPYSDRHSIVWAYSRREGSVSLLAGAGAGRGATRNRALLMPLSVVECVADIRPGRDIHPISQLRPLIAPTSMLSMPGRVMTAQFLAETLGIVLAEGQADEGMWAFLTQSVSVLGDPAARGMANFHIAFLFALARVAGISPDMSTYRPGYCFDMVDATFTPTLPLRRAALDARDADAMASLARMNYRNMHMYKMNRADRNRALDVAIDYFSLHYASLRSLHSLGVLRSML